MRGCRVMSKNQQKIYIHHYYYWINLPWDHGRMIDIVIKPNFKRSPETRREMRSCASSRRSVRVHDRLEGWGRARGCEQRCERRWWRCELCERISVQHRSEDWMSRNGDGEEARVFSIWLMLSMRAHIVRRTAVSDLATPPKRRPFRGGMRVCAWWCARTRHDPRRHLAILCPECARRCSTRINSYYIHDEEGREGGVFLPPLFSVTRTRARLA